MPARKLRRLLWNWGLLQLIKNQYMMKPLLGSKQPSLMKSSRYESNLPAIHSTPAILAFLWVHNHAKLVLFKTTKAVPHTVSHLSKALISGFLKLTLQVKCCLLPNVANQSPPMLSLHLFSARHFSLRAIFLFIYLLITHLPQIRIQALREQESCLFCSLPYAHQQE